MHGTDRKTVHPSADRRIAFTELAGFVLVGDLKDCHTKSPFRRHHRPIEKKLARIKLLLEIIAVLVHQLPLFAGNVMRKSRTRRNQFEIVMMFIHGYKMILQREILILHCPWQSGMRADARTCH